MKIFQLDNIYTVVCDFKGTRSGFKHTANLRKNGLIVSEIAVKYLNRTWESFEYETILKKVVDNYFCDKKHEKYLQIIKDMI